MLAKRFNVVRDASDGARWEGVANVMDGRVVEQGAWVMADGQRFEGRMEMEIGGGVLRVIQPFEVHEYEVREIAGGFEGEYRCGADVYVARGEYPARNGWKMRFEVAGPNKASWQEVVYTRV